jgi:5-methylcytosine-specific restriction endonuclease McrA
MLSEKNMAIFMQRTAQLFQKHWQRAQAAGQTLDYRLGDLRHFVHYNLGPHHCHYCCGPVEAATFEIDYKIPPARGGSFIFHNLAIVCKDCGQAKGWLDHFEYRELVSLLRTWAPPIRRNFIARLRAGRTIPLRLTREKVVR